MRENTITCTTALVCALVGSTLGAKPATAQTQTDKFVSTIERLKRSVAPVVCVDASNPSATQLLSVQGTAVFVAKDGTFLTPSHVLKPIVTGAIRNPCPTTAVYLPIGGWRWVKHFDVKYLYFSAGDCTQDANLDLAVCKPLQNAKRVTGSDAAPVAFEVSIVRDGTPVAFAGFPQPTVTPLTSRGVVAGYTELDEHGPRSLVLDKNSWPGSSGSPVFTEDGRVVGIVISTGGPGQDGMTFAVTAAYARRFLDSMQRQSQRGTETTR